jgi:TRAP-type C4-dicarboxylate transport system permease small subunit
MKLIKMIRKNKPTVWLLLLSIVYITFCCLIFFSLALVIVQLIISHRVAVEQSDVKYVLVASVIAGTAAAFRSWLFAKIDERKARKSPPSDPE